MVERIIELCARNRVLVLLSVALALLGAVAAIRRIKLDAIPDLSDPQVIVFTEWGGRSPTLVEDQVTYPIAARLIGTPRVVDVRGTSMFGMSFIQVVFQEGTDPYWARSRVLEYLNGLRGTLPEGAEPQLGPDATGVGWVFQYALVDRSGRHGLDQLRTFQDFTLRYALGSVPGVAEVASVGGYQKQYQVTVDPDKLRAFGVTLAEVTQAIRNSNNDVGGRILEMAGREYYIRGRGYIQDLGALEKIALRASGAGTPLLVKDVATVRFGPELRRGLLEWNGEGEAVGAVVVMRYGENALEVIERVKKKIGELRPSFPPGVELEIAYDRSGIIQRSVTTLLHALLEEAIVVSLVIVLFLLHLRSSLLPILSLPIAVALSFIPMYLLDIPSTIMSLGGIAIAIGATVDAEIVMIEAAHKKLERAGPDVPAAERHRLLAEAAREVTPAIFFSLLIIAVAFLPVFTLTGQAGRLFKPLAYTKTFVMLISAVLSITFAPALRDLLIRGKIRPEHRHPVSRFIVGLYDPFVHVALRKPKTTVAIGALALLSAVPVALKLGHEFMPPLNEGDILYMPITFPNISIEEAKRQLQIQDRLLREFPEVKSVFGKVGRVSSATDPAPLSMVETTVQLKPAAQWRRLPRTRWYSSWAPSWCKPVLRGFWPEQSRITWEQLTAEMNQRLQLPGWTNAWTLPIKTRIDMLTTGVRTPVGLKIFGTDLHAIEAVGSRLEQLLAGLPGTRSVLYERNLGGLYVDIVPRPEALARYGLQSGALQEVIETAIGGAVIGTVIDGRNRFSINVRYPQDLRNDVAKLQAVLVPVPMQLSAAAPASAPAPAQQTQQSFLPLGQLADVHITGGPPMVRDEAGLLVGYVYVDIDQERHDLGGYVDQAKQVVDQAVASGQLALPPGSYLKWTGQYEQLGEMLARMKVVIPLTIGLIVMLLFLQFRSIAEVLIVLLSIPFALVGSVWLLYLLDYRLSTAVWVGIIALVGLAAQTGIVMIVYVDSAYLRWKQAGRIHGLADIIAAHKEGTVQRVRPKLMTVATMLVGLVPLLWATSSGADVMKRIAAPMVGGLVTSAFLTLEIIPVVVTYWRYEQLLWERLAARDPRLLARLQRSTALLAGGLGLAAVALLARLYLVLPPAVFLGALGGGLALFVGGYAAYLGQRPAARRLIWPGGR
jgi:Cu(I)/Ag(I) efflux system membrane protein CusA/SilA